MTRDDLLSWLKQMVRFAIVGLSVNLIGYLLYVLVTWLWLGPKTAVTLFYPTAAIIGYFAHARFAFSYTGDTAGGMLRYAAAHLVGYLTNISLLYVLVDLLGFPHQLIQAIAIFVVGGLLFCLMRFFVFRSKRVHDQP